MDAERGEEDDVLGIGAERQDHIEVQCDAEAGLEVDVDVPLVEDEADLYAQLAAKERDLILAAELGKALLEKNEDLSRRNEHLTEEYSSKIEELTQEKHALRLRLESMEREYENTVKDLRDDVVALRRQLEEQQDSNRQRDINKSDMIHELTQQNDRLNEQLKRTAHSEEHFRSQVEGLKLQCSQRRNSMHDHVHQMQVLREEIDVLSDKHTDVEHRLYSLTEQRDALAADLEEANTRIHLLEKEKHEQSLKMNSQSIELSDLRERSSQLQDRVAELSAQASSSFLDQSSASLFNELEMSGAGHTSMDSLSSPDSPTPNHLSLPHWSHIQSSPFSGHPNLVPGAATYQMMEEEDGIECDDDFNLTASLCDHSLNDMQLMVKLHSVPESDDEKQMKQEVAELYMELRQMVAQLQGRNMEELEEEMWSHRLHSPHISPTDSLPPGTLTTVLTELRALMEDLLKYPHHREKTKSIGMHDEVEQIDELEMKVECLERELDTTQDQVNRLKARLEFKDLELQRKAEELNELSSKVKLSLQHDEILALQEERDRLQDKTAGISRDDIISQARSDRNCAIEKRNSMEMELTRAKLDLMKLDSQLLEAIQQKVQLSQQLEQWQIDMQDLIDLQMNKRLHQEDKMIGSSDI